MNIFSVVIRQEMHEVLVTDEDGKYHALWHAQAQYYEDWDFSSENRIAELDKLFKRIYEDMVNEKLSEGCFQMLSDDYEREQAELRVKIDQLTREINEQEDQTENVDRFIRQVKKHLYLDELTPHHP